MSGRFSDLFCLFYPILDENAYAQDDHFIFVKRTMCAARVAEMHSDHFLGKQGKNMFETLFLKMKMDKNKCPKTFLKKKS